jgi:tRNA 2-thiouridine synthesizing protein C
MKKYLFVMRHLPHVGSRVQEALDQMLTTAAFDQAVSVLFLDDGVWQLKRGQDRTLMAGKDTAAIFNALAIYDVNQLLVERESLASRGLQAEDLILPVELLSRQQVNAFISLHDVVIPD